MEHVEKIVEKVGFSDLVWLVVSDFVVVFVVEVVVVLVEDSETHLCFEYLVQLFEFHCYPTLQNPCLILFVVFLLLLGVGGVHVL